MCGLQGSVSLWIEGTYRRLFAALQIGEWLNRVFNQECGTPIRGARRRSKSGGAQSREVKPPSLPGRRAQGGKPFQQARGQTSQLLTYPGFSEFSSHRQEMAGLVLVQVLQRMKIHPGPALDDATAASDKATASIKSFTLMSHPFLKLWGEVPYSSRCAELWERDSRAGGLGISPAPSFVGAGLSANVSVMKETP